MTKINSPSDKQIWALENGKQLFYDRLVTDGTHRKVEYEHERAAAQGRALAAQMRMCGDKSQAARIDREAAAEQIHANGLRADRTQTDFSLKEKFDVALQVCKELNRPGLRISGHLEFALWCAYEEGIPDSSSLIIEGWPDQSNDDAAAG